MSYNLWRGLLEDDIETFRRHVATATFAAGAARGATGGPATAAGLKVGSPSNLAVSPKTPAKVRKGAGHHAAGATAGARPGGLVLTRGDVNTKDNVGRTILHHAVSSRSADAAAFVEALLQIPFLDLYAQDLESGWTALHRALYFGNIWIAHALMARDVHDATDYTTHAHHAHAHAGGLVKIKDHEGNSPFEVFGLTIAGRAMHPHSSTLPRDSQSDDDGTGMEHDDEAPDHHQPHNRAKRSVVPPVNLHGDEVFAFGSNKNLSLGVGDGDDRHFPERLQFERPAHLLQRLRDDHLAARRKSAGPDDLTTGGDLVRPAPDLPDVVRHRPMVIQDVVMSKLHTAVLTNDPVANLYVCGFGPGGRLGTGDEYTCFTYRCIQAGGFAKRRIASVALGQDHTVAVCAQGEVFTWGSNRYGQLGYALPEGAPDEIPMQLTPRQLYGYVKKELILGAAASSLHTAIYTATALYTFGRNDGQLGLMDADARSLECQVVPRRVGVSILQSPIRAVSAIDRATAVLLDSHDLVVFTHYGWTKVLFPLETFTNYYIADDVSRRHNLEANYITRITGGSNTLCAMSTFGEVYAIEVPKVSDNVPSNTSTTNPAKARNALPPPTRLWAIRKAHMSATDVAVGQDGSIILCTASGSVWKKEKRANVKSVREMRAGAARPKDYKFVRIPHLTGAVAVRSNAFGSFVAVRKDCAVTRDQIVPDAPSLWADVFPLLPFADYGQDASAAPSDHDPARIARAIIASPTAEEDLGDLCRQRDPLHPSQCNVWITSTTTDVRVPVHSFLLQGRSRVMRAALAEFTETYYFAIPDVVSIEYGADGHIQVAFPGVDILTLVNLVFYLYTESVVDVWHYTARQPASASRFRSVRLELMKIASHLELRELERSVRVMTEPARHLARDLERALLDPHFFSDADVIVELADHAEMPAHSALLRIRCPFFEGLFNGRAGGLWMTSRRRAVDDDESGPMRVDLKHMDARIFQMVRRHLYADTGDELFDDVATGSLDEFIDVLLELLSAANELMLDRLAQVCQQELGKYVTVRNVCALVNIVAECSVDHFKRAALEYICLNLESMLEMRLLDELDDDLWAELDDVVKANQQALLPVSRGEYTDAALLEAHPQLASQIEAGKQRRIDSMRLRSRLMVDEERHAASAKSRIGSLERQPASPATRSAFGGRSAESPVSSPGPSPAITPLDAGDDLPFDMDDDGAAALPRLGMPTTRPSMSRLSSSGNVSSRPSTSSDTASLTTSVTPLATHAGSPLAHSPASAVAAEAAVVSVSGFERAKGPWSLRAHNVEKNDLKNIMAQASSASRVSSLTEAMRAASISPKTPAKMSQKERKRQQQQLQRKDSTPGASGPAVPPTTPRQPSSPWQVVAKPAGPGAPPFSPAALPTPSEAKSLPPTPAPPKARQSSAPNIPSTRPGSVDPARSPQAPFSAQLTSPSKPAAAPPIQSIRHTPVVPRASSSADARASMAEILAQQQIEKSAVKEAVVKRSLQEIQQEQEFQEWWDTESRRVQDEEARASTTPAGRRSGGTRRRGAPRTGAGKGRTRGGPEPTAETPAASATVRSPDAAGRARGPHGERIGPASLPGHTRL